jgi:hypothetical protein
MGGGGSLTLHTVKKKKREATLWLLVFVWLISHQPTVLLFQNKPATSNQPTVLFSQNKSEPAKRTCGVLNGYILCECLMEDPL